METPSAATRPDLALQLPRDAYWMLIHTLHTSLPPPPPGDDPEAIARRDRDAIAQVASLLPVTAAEARLAARFVAADAQAHECLRLARLYPTDVTQALKCNAQAATMWRQSDSALRALQRMQAARSKRDSDPAAADQAAWTEHCAQGLMADALHGGPAAFEPAPPPLRPSRSRRPAMRSRRGIRSRRPSSTPRSIPIARWRSAATAACRPTRPSHRRRTTSSTPWSLAERRRCWRWIGRWRGAGADRRGPRLRPNG